VAALLMAVALMFAAEIGWLMVDPTARGGQSNQGLEQPDTIVDHYPPACTEVQVICGSKPILMM
jgi:hypothetical protein